MIVTAEAVADYLRETRKHQGRRGEPDHVPSVPGRSAGQDSERPQGRRGAGAHRSAAGRRSAADARSARRAWPRAWRTAASPTATCRIPSTRPIESCRRHAAALFRLLRPRQPRPAAGRPDRRRREHAARRRAARSSSTSRSTSSATSRSLRSRRFTRSRSPTPIPASRNSRVHGSENPNLMPKNSITVRMHSVGGWGAITTGKNLAMTLFDLLGYHIKANPKYGSEKKGQPTTYYLVRRAGADPHQLRLLLRRRRAVARPERVPALQSAGRPEEGRRLHPPEHSREARGRLGADPGTLPEASSSTTTSACSILDAFKIAREEATDPELQLRMQGNRVPGRVLRRLAGDERRRSSTNRSCSTPSRSQLEHKFGKQGRARRRGQPARGAPRLRRGPRDHRKSRSSQRRGRTAAQGSPDLPVMLKQLPGSATPTTDIHRFWEQTGSFYLTRQGNDNLVDPFIGLSCDSRRDRRVPRHDRRPLRASGVDPRELHRLRQLLHASARTARSPAWSIRIDTIFETAVKQVAERGGRTVKHLPARCARSSRSSAARIDEAGEQANVRAPAGPGHRRASAQVAGRGRRTRPNWSRNSSASAKRWATSSSPPPQPYWTVREKKQKGTGGLLSITVNPYTCKGCMECVKVCNDDALRIGDADAGDASRTCARTGTSGIALPTTLAEFIRIDNLDEKIGALRNAAARQAQLPRHGRRRRRLPRLRRKDRRPSVHRHRRSADAAARREAGRARLDDLIVAPRPAHPHEARRHARPERQRQASTTRSGRRCATAT